MFRLRRTGTAAPAAHEMLSGRKSVAAVPLTGLCCSRWPVCIVSRDEIVEFLNRGWFQHLDTPQCVRATLHVCQNRSRLHVETCTFRPLQHPAPVTHFFPEAMQLIRRHLLRASDCLTFVLRHRHVACPHPSRPEKRERPGAGTRTGGVAGRRLMLAATACWTAASSAPLAAADARLQVQPDPVSQENRSDPVPSRRNHNGSPTMRGSGIDGGLDRRGVVAHPIATHAMLRYCQHANVLVFG